MHHYSRKMFSLPPKADVPLKTFPPSSLPRPLSTKKEFKVNPLDTPINISDSLKLISDVLVFSKYFLVEKSENSVGVVAANKWISKTLLLDKELKECTDIERKNTFASRFISIAKADLFPSGKLSEIDYDNLLKMGIIPRENREYGEIVSQFLSQKDIGDYIEKQAKKTYASALHELVDRCCRICTIGFASYSLLQSRTDYDKQLIERGKTHLTSYDVKNTLAIEKTNIIKLITTLAGQKKTTKRAGEISALQNWIESDIDHINNKLVAIENRLVETSKNEIKKQNAMLALGIASSQLPKNKIAELSLDPLQVKECELTFASDRNKNAKELLQTIETIRKESALVLANKIKEEKELEEKIRQKEESIAILQREILDLKQSEEKINIHLSDKEKLILEMKKESSDEIDRLKSEVFTLTQQQRRETVQPTVRAFVLAVMGILLGAILCLTMIGAYWGLLIIRKSFDYYRPEPSFTPVLPSQQSFLADPPSSPVKTRVADVPNKPVVHLSHQFPYPFNLSRLAPLKPIEKDDKEAPSFSVLPIKIK